jgi:hypothetical protein
MSYFWGKASGVNADLKRHREEETELRQLIEELENSESNEFNDRRLSECRYFLQQLLASKAMVSDKLGRK